MGLGLGRLRLCPDAFWGMTPRELAAAADGLRGPLPHAGGGLDRAGLQALMGRFPDRGCAGR